MYLSYTKLVICLNVSQKNTRPPMKGQVQNEVKRLNAREHSFFYCLRYASEIKHSCEFSDYPER